MSLPEDLNQFATLVKIMAGLRAPDGCLWDRKQTHASLRENLLEECYEALAALDEGDAGKLCEELGDLLMQIVFHSQIAAEAREFEVGDVISSINAKLIHRHPHIFGSAKVENAEQVAHNWEALKQEEREAGTSILASLPRQMPALGYSQSLQRRVTQAGFDWGKIDGVIDRLAEQVRELRQAGSQQEGAQGFGDLLFTLANLARQQGVDLEAALRQANQRFYRVFTCLEELCRQRGLSLDKLSPEEQSALWEEAKKRAES